MTEHRYSTLNLIEDIKKEIQNYSEILTQIFPQKKKCSHKKLSEIWGKSISYVSNLIRKYENNEDYVLSDKSLHHLRKNLRINFGNQALGCFKIIKKYKASKLSLNHLIELLRIELGRIRSYVEISYAELSIILGKNEDYIYHIRKYILNQNNRRYNPDYKFDLETLGEFKYNLRSIFKDKSNKCIEFIDKYILLNQDLKEYLFERVTIQNPHYFQRIDTVEKAYWMGFLCADAWITGKEYGFLIRLELSTTDRERLIEFAKVIGFATERIKDRKRWYNNKEGRLKIKESSYVQFKSKSMVKDLLENGFSSSACNRGLPIFICNLEQSNLALAFLLGVFDGDGSWFGGRSAEIYTSNKEFLKQIKHFFRIAFSIRKTKKILIDEETGNVIHRAAYRITIGSGLYEKMMNSYINSMKRKRAPEFSI